MTAITFDTLKFVKTLEAAGVSAKHAEAFASAVRDSSESADLVTRKDLQIELQKELAPIKADIALLRQEMIQLEQRMTIKLGGMLVVAVGVIAALIKL